MDKEMLIDGRKRIFLLLPRAEKETFTSSFFRSAERIKRSLSCQKMVFRPAIMVAD